jgi:hypothetical protein
MKARTIINEIKRSDDILRSIDAGRTSMMKGWKFIRTNYPAISGNVDNEFSMIHRAEIANHPEWAIEILDTACEKMGCAKGDLYAVINSGRVDSQSYSTEQIAEYIELLNWLRSPGITDKYEKPINMEKHEDKSGIYGDSFSYSVNIDLGIIKVTRRMRIINSKETNTFYRYYVRYK